MVCPKCGGDLTVKASFRDKEGIYRLRACLDCNTRFTTSEVISEDNKFYELRHKYQSIYHKLYRSL